MKEESVLNVLMYLFKYHIQDNLEFDNSYKELVDQLEDAGFNRNAIDKAFDWLDFLGKQCADTTEIQPLNSVRIYSNEEQAKLNSECLGLITFLEQKNILKPHTREMVITQALALQEEGIDLHLLKWVTLMVLFTQPDEKDALTCMETLVLHDSAGSIH